MKVVALVPAAGSGSRVGGPRPKQFLPLGGSSVLALALAALDRCEQVAEIIVALPAGIELGPGDRPKVMRAALRTVVGGARRQESVYRAFLACQAAEAADLIVLVHDAARPLVPPALVEAVARAAAESGAAIAAVPASDTVKEVGADGAIRLTHRRDTLFLAQTPQAFRHGVLRAAFDRAARDHFSGTDEAALVERTGQKVRIVLGSERNIKITTPLDLHIAETILNAGDP